jgi:hypothetical protein
VVVDVLSRPDMEDTMMIMALLSPTLQLFVDL